MNLTSTAQTSACEPASLSQNGSERWRRRIFPLVTLGVVGLFATLQLSHWPERLRYPGEEDAAEGTQLSEMVQLRRGGQVYGPPENGKFVGAIYGPLCYIVGAAIINPKRPAYLPLRVLSLIATLGIAALSFVFVSNLTKNKFAGALAPLILLSSAYIGRYGISARADMVALLLSFAGFVVFFRNRNSWLALIASAILMLISIFYKQQFLGAPAAVFFFLLLQRQFRKAIAFSAMLGGGAALLIATVSWLTFPHQEFFRHFVIYNRLPFDANLIVPEILMFAVPLFVPLLGSADYLDANKDGLVKLYALLAAGGYFLLLFSSGSGADTNRCLEAVVILTCLLSARIATTEGVLSRSAWTAALVFTLVVVAKLGAAFVVPKVTAQDFSADRALQRYLQQSFPEGTSALTYYPADPIRAGLDVPVTNLWHYCALVRKGLFSDGSVVDRIEHGGYGVVLLDFELTSENQATTGDFYTTTNMRKAILYAYQEQARLELPTPEVTRFSSKTLHVWVPRTVGEHE